MLKPDRIPPPEKGDVLVVAGPTSSGKTSLAIELALKFNGEIISADSRQVYRGLNIGSGKVTENEKKGVTHHLIDILDPGERYSVNRFQADTLSLIQDIESRKKLPIICGGTGLYIESVVEDYNFNAVKKNILGVGKSGYNPKFKVYLLDHKRHVLRDRIAKRVDARLREGMLEEVRDLIESGVDCEWLVSLGLEYRYLTEWIISQNEPFSDIITKIKLKSYQFAKRQDTWFRRWNYAIKIKLV